MIPSLKRIEISMKEDTCVLLGVKGLNMYIILITYFYRLHIVLILLATGIKFTMDNMYPSHKSFKIKIELSFKKIELSLKKMN